MRTRVDSAIGSFDKSPSRAQESGISLPVLRLIDENVDEVVFILRSFDLLNIADLGDEAFGNGLAADFAEAVIVLLRLGFENIPPVETRFETDFGDDILAGEGKPDLGDFDSVKLTSLGMLIVTPFFVRADFRGFTVVAEV